MSIYFAGKLLYCRVQAKLKKLVNGTKSLGVETIFGSNSKSTLEEIQREAKEAMMILSIEPEGSEDQRLAERLVRDLVQVRTIMDFSNMKL